ncbi:hypothetical protein [Sphingomonas sp. 10B4]|uniref:hypothetical protein n=1 Tax=Sphingomonas sp. 10B4 TaxID=3048575 RepID=UPI003A0FF6A9
MKGKKRCKLHGGKSTGAPKGNKNSWKHGARSGEFMALSRLIDRIAEGPAA